MASVFNRGRRDKPNWYGKFRDRDGKWKMVPTHQPTKAQARRYIETVEARIANGKVGIENREGEMTFDALADYWLTNHSAAACVSHTDNISRMKHLRAVFGRKVLSEITAQRVDEFKAAKSTETKTDPATGKKVPRWQPATLNRIVALLRKVLNDAVRWGYLPAAPKMRMLPVPEQDFDYLPRDEAERLLSWTRQNAPQDFPLYAAAIYTGGRMGELYGLQWGDVDLEQGLLTFRRSYGQPYTKSKKIRRVRVNHQLSIILKNWRLVCPPGDLVFPRPNGTPRTREVPPIGFAKHLAAARCHDIGFHALRHTAASLMTMAGISMRTVQQMLGHCTVQVTERYAHLAPDFMAKEAERLSLDIGTMGQVLAISEGAR